MGGVTRGAAKQSASSVGEQFRPGMRRQHCIRETFQPVEIVNGSEGCFRRGIWRAKAGIPQLQQQAMAFFHPTFLQSDLPAFLSAFLSAFLPAEQEALLQTLFFIKVERR